MLYIFHKLLILLFFFGCYQTATAEPYEDANAALMRGDGSGALRIMVPLAVRGQGEAQFVVGMLYLQGNGVLQDVDQAVTWLSKAGETGHIRAQMTLAGLFLDPNSPKRDNEAGIGWYRKAAGERRGPFGGENPGRGRRGPRRRGGEAASRPR